MKNMSMQKSAEAELSIFRNGKLIEDVIIWVNEEEQNI